MTTLEWVLIAYLLVGLALYMCFTESEEFEGLNGVVQHFAALILITTLWLPLILAAAITNTHEE